ncbi:MAG: phosphomannomutase/phosphoglucomutase [Candidatus Eisenbacteria bacterium]
MELNPEIFREYDIRGRVGVDLTDRSVALLAKATGSYLQQHGAKRVSLASDNRLSSDGFRGIVARELAGLGLGVTDFGVIPTPVFYFTLFRYPVDGGIMITGSHNPPEFNGFKVASGKSTIYGDEIRKIRDIAARIGSTPGGGRIEKADPREAYIEAVLSQIDIKRNLRIAVDCGNGTAGLVVRDMFARLGTSAELLYSEPDGRFPNHHPDPTVPRNLEDLIRAVRGGRLEAGIAYDGDADRIGVIDEKCEILWGDKLLILFARDIIARHPGCKVIFEVKCSQALPEAITSAGGVPIMWKTGHSLIKEKMKEEGALLAGEMSGHIFFNDRYYGYDDAVYASLRLLEILSRSRSSLSSQLSDVPKYFITPEIRLDCPDRLKFKVVEDLKHLLKPDHQVIDIDGVRVVYPDGWGLVRASNTQPVLVLRFEARTQARLTEIRAELMSRLQEVGGANIGIPEA